ncbi:flagellar hook-associated protein FlgK [Sulfitobacter sp. SK012]|uniref:flagellar hook-associated protein FlgK n=1 Tax=Sulfitobacter sp. SK012 TaxID=1389005 RepID=UPI000E0BDB20|nr:flagellar hook-associated protein FlgK [Sulfitobacter sp. SK012]AXI44794.1 flagellar hook-associated protein FlgK [Sulfitobacter sp. SK012]
MSITGALNNAMSGLRAAGRASELVSSNISNALTPGYGRRVLALSTSAIGDFGGVKIDGITRMVNEGVASDKRLAEAKNNGAQLIADFFGRIEGLTGKPNEAFSISARMAAFESGLISASSRPDAPERLAGSVSDAKALIASLSDASDGIQKARTAADSQISRDVKQLNTGLEQLQMLNSQITSSQVRGSDTASLMDQRQQVVDRIGALVQIRTVPRDNGQIAIYTEGGAILLDGSAIEVGFTSANVVTAYQSVGAGTLSGMTINGLPIRSDSQTGPLRGGSIGAQFAIRDEYGPTAQRQIDALARDLVERFQDPTIDTTLAPGDPGLFTDGGVAFDPLDEVGLSQRLTLNAAVDPDQGGEAFRLRDGLNATIPGYSGDASLLNTLRETLNTTRIPASGSFGGGSFSAVNLVSALTSQFGAERTESERLLSFSSARLGELTEQLLADGVDTDRELQHLMLLEQSYAANARVHEAVDEMMQTIMRI